MLRSHAKYQCTVCEGFIMTSFSLNHFSWKHNHPNSKTVHFDSKHKTPKESRKWCIQAPNPSDSITCQVDYGRAAGRITVATSVNQSGKTLGRNRHQGALKPYQPAITDSVLQSLVCSKYQPTLCRGATKRSDAVLNPA